jgi:hypothetical protein
MGGGGKKHRLGRPVLLAFRTVRVSPITTRDQRQITVQVSSHVAESRRSVGQVLRRCAFDYTLTPTKRTKLARAIIA